FFFSSRRRHTRFSRDWSSDVCSSDLIVISYAYQLNTCLYKYHTCWPQPTFMIYNNGASNLHTESSPRFHMFLFFHSASVISVQSALSISNCSSNCPHSVGSETTAAIS